METSYRAISKRRLRELQGYVAWSASVFRVTAFLLIVAVPASLLRLAERSLLPSQLHHPVWWIVPTVLWAAVVYASAKRWTGGSSFRAAARVDPARGLAAAHRVVAVDAIEVEEQEDEGPAYFLLTAEGRTMVFAGQYLDRYRRKGFPWRDFEILEAPQSKVFFGLVPLGERLAPSVSRPPFTCQEYKSLCARVRNYVILDLDFGALKEGRTTSG